MVWRSSVGHVKSKGASNASQQRPCTPTAESLSVSGKIYLRRVMGNVMPQYFAGKSSILNTEETSSAKCAIIKEVSSSCHNLILHAI
jgi:hypothetical protein